MPGFLFSVRIGSPTPSSARECCSSPLWVQRGRHTSLRARECGTQFRRKDRHSGLYVYYNPSTGFRETVPVLFVQIPTVLPTPYNQGVTKRYRLSWLTNSALVYEPKCRGRGLRGLSKGVQQTYKIQEYFPETSVADRGCLSQIPDTNLFNPFQDQDTKGTRSRISNKEFKYL